MVTGQNAPVPSKMDAAGVEAGAEAGVERVASPRRPLLPILPQYPPPAGALVVDKEETRVGAELVGTRRKIQTKLEMVTVSNSVYVCAVYLAPLMTTSKEIYFAKHKDLLLGGNSNVVADTEEQQGESRSKRQLPVSLERHLARLRKFGGQTVSLNQQTSSMFDVPSLEGQTRSNASSAANASEMSSVAASADGQLKKMKQRVRLLPITDDDRATFWETIKGYERMRAYYHQTALAGGASTPMGFNMEAAFKKMVRQTVLGGCIVI
ncbi:unnamed protein product [Phytophthora fragariaefolia]|uniref:Unnamed protein product n=1 Tax=Phytophthora fragariaefolia TaxID=1490495 RepID=A0A9W6UEG6_9STRA|nr:unnamed protein product [Phytophthora fragariaefolia]